VSYAISEQVVIEWEIVDIDGTTPITDATVTGTITLPDGSTASATISHAGGSNVYRALYDPTMAGTHAYRLEATGTADGAKTGTFTVHPDPDPGPSPTLDPSTQVGRVRLLIPDRDRDNLIFSDDDIAALLAIEGDVLKRAVALALETIASDEVMVSKVIKSQDLSTDGAKVSAELRARARDLRRQADDEEEDAAGGFDIVDFVDPFTRRFESF